MAEQAEGLEANLAEVAADITAVVKAAGEKPPNFAFGESEKHRQEAPPRVVWVPIHARRENTVVTRGKPLERTLYNRRWTVQARVWADSFREIEKLVRHIVAAADRKWHGSFAYVSEEVPTDAGDQTLGFVDYLTFTVDIPLRDEPLLSVRPTATAITPEIAQPEVPS